VSSITNLIQPLITLIGTDRDVKNIVYSNESVASALSELPIHFHPQKEGIYRITISNNENTIRTTKTIIP
jgi:hypothetical protein